MFALKRFTFGIVATLMALTTAVSHAQTDLPADPPPTQTIEKVTMEQVDLAISQVDASEELDDTVKARIKDNYTQAKSELEAEATQQTDADLFRSWIESSETDIEQATKKKEFPPEVYDFVVAEKLELNELQKDVLTLEQQLADVKKNLADALPESQRRVTRLASIAGELVEAQAVLKEIESQPTSATPNNDPAMLVQSRLTLIRARGQKQRAIISALENERDAYAAQGELPRLKVDLLTAQSKQLEQDIEQLVNLVAEQRRKDAESQLQEANLLWETSPESLKRFAKENINLAETRIELAKKIRNAAQRRETVANQLKQWEEDYQRVQERVAALKSDQLGLKLVEKRTQLPSSSTLQHELAESEAELRKYQLKLFELEDRRADFSDMDAAIAIALAEIKISPDDVDVELKKIFDLESQILDSLLKDAKRYFSVRIAIKDDQLRLANVVQEYRKFIERQVFWTRSAEPMSLKDISRSREAIGWLANGETWSDAQRQANSRFTRNPVLAILIVVGLALLLLFRTRILANLDHLGNVAASVSCRSFLPTSRALGSTLLLAAFWPALLWFLGWSISGSVTDPLPLISIAFSTTAILYFIAECVRQVWHSNGLAESHFEWTDGPATNLRKNVSVLLYGGAPLVFLGTIFLKCREPDFQSSIGRICLIAFLLLISGVFIRASRTKTGVLTSGTGQNPGGPLRFLGNIWYLLIGLATIGFAMLAIFGFQFAIEQLTFNLLRSFGFVFCLFVIRALLFRWVRVRRRRIRWQRLLTAKQAAEEGVDEGETTDLETLVAREEKADLVAMDQQTRQFISICLLGIGLIGLSAIWLEVFPAVSSILETKMYDVEGVGGALRTISIGILLFTILILFVLVVAWRNLPGLVDVLLVGRFGIEPSTRYAISTLLQYTSALIAVLLVCALLGLTWGKAQWLIAALSVGLGFGLQEIVANFVCGVLLLFERPIRVGDFVTLGDSEGVVTRIRSRATTVRNWDRQEVIIPNKELITGRIVNWTLDDQVIRIMIRVGVAYGSDTNHTRELINEILQKSTSVLDDPRPIVAFEEFGDSTLNFTIRAFLDNISERWETIHSLNTSIAQRFAEEGIEIAFPQRDLHIRSVHRDAQIGENTFGTEK